MSIVERQPASIRVDQSQARLRAKLGNSSEHMAPDFREQGRERYTRGPHYFHLRREPGGLAPLVVHESLNERTHFLLHPRGVIHELTLTTPDTRLDVTEAAQIQRVIVEAGEIHTPTAIIGSAVDAGKLFVGTGELVMAIQGGHVDADTVFEGVSAGPDSHFKAKNVHVLSVQGVEDHAAKAEVETVDKYLVLSAHSDVQVGELGKDAVVIVLGSDVATLDTSVTYNETALTPGIYREGESGLERVEEAEQESIFDEFTAFLSRRTEEDLLTRDTEEVPSVGYVGGYPQRLASSGYPLTEAGYPLTRRTTVDEVMVEEMPVDDWAPPRPIMDGIDRYTGQAFFDEVNRRSKIFWEDVNARPRQAGEETTVVEAEIDVVDAPVVDGESSVATGSPRRRRRTARVAVAAGLAGLMAAGVLAWHNLQDRVVATFHKTKPEHGPVEKPPVPPVIEQQPISLTHSVVAQEGATLWDNARQAWEEANGEGSANNREIQLVTALDATLTGGTAITEGQRYNALDTFALRELNRIMNTPVESLTVEDRGLRERIDTVLDTIPEEWSMEDLIAERRDQFGAILDELQERVDQQNTVIALSREAYLREATTLHQRRRASRLVFPDEV